MTDDEVVRRVRECVAEATSDDDPWCSVPVIEQSVGVSSTQIRAAVHQLDEEGEVFCWHGKVAEGDSESLLVVIEYELESQYPRKALIGNANGARVAAKGGEE